MFTYNCLQVRVEYFFNEWGRQKECMLLNHILHVFVCVCSFHSRHTTDKVAPFLMFYFPNRIQSFTRDTLRHVASKRPSVWACLSVCFTPVGRESGSNGKGRGCWHRYNRDYRCEPHYKLNSVLLVLFPSDTCKCSFFFFFVFIFIFIF